MNLTIWVSVLASLGVPLVLMAQMATFRGRTRLAGTALAAMTLALLLMMLVVSPVWAWIGLSFRTIYSVLFALCLGLLAYRLRRKPWLPGRAWRPWLAIALHGVLAVVFGGIAGGAMAGRSVDTQAIALEMPLGPGRYFVSQGGASALLNAHASAPAQRYGIDFLALNESGRRAAGVFPSDVRAYAIYGRDVIAPCAGTVLDRRDGMPPTPVGGRNPDQPAGNYVTLACSGRTILLAHLIADSVDVAVGDRVETGQVLGAAGNSGNSTEPHLHIHAVAGRVSDHKALITTATPVPIRIHGRFLVRNDIVETPR